MRSEKPVGLGGFELDPLIHVAVPFFALRLLGLRSRRAVPISLMALLPDLDALLLLHRSPSHSIVVVLAVALPILLLVYRFRRGLLGSFPLALFAVSSHLLLDLFNGYTPILWPLYGQTVWIRVGLTAHIASSPSLTPSMMISTKPYTLQPLQSLDALLLTGEGLIISTILLASLTAGLFIKTLKRHG